MNKPAIRRRKLTRRLTEATAAQTDALIRGIVENCMPPDHDIKRMGMNEIRRLFLIMPRDEQERLWKKLTPQQQKSCPNYLNK